MEQIAQWMIIILFILGIIWIIYQTKKLRDIQ